MSVTEERAQPTQPGLRASTVAQRVARPMRGRQGSWAGANRSRTANRPSTVAVAAMAAGNRAAQALTPHRRKLRPTIQYPQTG